MKRRSFLVGIAAALSAPAIVQAANIMKVASLKESVLPPGVHSGRIIGIALNTAGPGELVTVPLGNYGARMIIQSDAQLYAGGIVMDTDLPPMPSFDIEYKSTPILLSDDRSSGVIMLKGPDLNGDIYALPRRRP